MPDIFSPRQRIAQRQALLFLLLFFLWALAYGALLINTFTDTYEAAIDHEIDADIMRLTDLDAGQGRAALIAALPSDVDDQAKQIYILAAENGERITGNLPHWPADFPLGSYFDWIDWKASVYFWIDIKARSVPLSDGALLLVGRNTLAFDVGFQRILWNALGVGALFALLAAIIGYAIARQPIKRVLALQTLARDIERGGYERRAPVSQRSDEIDFLAHAFNRMLDALTDSLLRVRAAGDALAHDLRTPLARLKIRLDQVRRSPIGAAEAEALERDLDAALSLLQNLLRLSRLEEKAEKLEAKPVSLESLAEEISDLYEPVVAEKGISISLDLNPALALGDSSLLMQAIVNLIENAFRHAPADSVLRIETGSEAQTVWIAVQDQGLGMTDEEITRAFDRFWRGEASRSTNGHGLGLPIARAIARHHGGDVILENRGGLRATVRLPRA